jgi:hypothetical protein
MPAGEHRVGLVASDLGSELEGLSERCHVWAVRLAGNEAIAQRIWDQQGEHSLESGVTLFQPSGRGPEEDCVSIIDTIVEHHGEDSHDPPLNVVEIFGAKLTEKIREEFAARGFRRLEPSPRGFVAFRDAP